MKDLIDFEAPFKTETIHRPKPEYFLKIKHIKQSLSKNKNYASTYKARQELQEVIDLFNDFSIKQSKKITTEAKSIPQAILSDKDESMNVYSSGSIQIKTAGNSVLSLLPEICLDHHQQVMQNRLSQDVKLARSKGDVLLPSNAFHVVISNTITIEHKYMVSQSGAHSDPVHSTLTQSVYTTKGPVKKTKTQIIADPDFGSSTTLDAYPVVSVPHHVDKFQKQIDQHNIFQIQLESLKQYRAQHLFEIAEVNKEIIKHITQYLLSLLLKKLLDFKPWIDKLQQPSDLPGTHHRCFKRAKKVNPS